MVGMSLIIRDSAVSGNLKKWFYVIFSGEGLAGQWGFLNLFFILFLTKKDWLDTEMGLHDPGIFLKHLFVSGSAF